VTVSAGFMYILNKLQLRAQIMVLLVVTQCSDAIGHQCFGGFQDHK